MNAIDVTGKAPGGNRIPIAELVPLDTPLVVQIFPIYACNFKCKYCELSIPLEKRGFISNTKSMDIKLYKKCIDDLQIFPNNIKVLRFVGMGEPLLHPQLPTMIKYASDTQKFDRIELITNASLLTNKLSEELILSGLNKLCISIQGTSEKKYLEISNIQLNYSALLNSIQYFYNCRYKFNTNCQIHIKIIDCALDDIEDKNRFFTLFGDMCDTIGVETAGPIHPGVLYNNQLQNKTVNQYGLECAHLNICSQPFLLMQINPDGNVVPCYSVPYPAIMGNCAQNSLLDIWTGMAYNNFRLKMLEGMKNMDTICNTCNIFPHRAYTEDNLDTQIEKLKIVYK